MSERYTTAELVRFVNRMARGCGKFEPNDAERMTVLIWRLQAADALCAAAKEMRQWIIDLAESGDAGWFDGSKVGAVVVFDKAIADYEDEEA